MDYETLKAFNPHLPPEPEKVEKPGQPEEDFVWEFMSEEMKAELQEQYKADLARWQEYEKTFHAWHNSAEYREATKRLADTVGDLEQRGFLQYDRNTRRYDLHPVVRGVAAGSMEAEERDRYGQRVVDYFSAVPHNPYEEAKTLQDLSPGLHIVRTLLKLGRFPEAERVCGGLIAALSINLEAYAEVLSLLRPFFLASWETAPKGLDDYSVGPLAGNAAFALHHCGELKESLALDTVSLHCFLRIENWDDASGSLNNISALLSTQNLPAKAFRAGVLACDLADACESREDLFKARLLLFHLQSQTGWWEAAETTWHLLEPMGRAWSRNAYRPGWVERHFAEFRYWQGCLEEAHLKAVEKLAFEGGDRLLIRSLHLLRGDWRSQQGEWALAAESFDKAVLMARERALINASSETGLALAKMRLGQLVEPRVEAERLAQLRDPAYRYLAMLWREIGDLEQAKQYALAAYKWAWADGEPYVNRFDLSKAAELLKELEVPIPDLPLYDPAKDEPFPWEAEAREAIDKLRAEKEARKKAEDSVGD